MGRADAADVVAGADFGDVVAVAAADGVARRVVVGVQVIVAVPAVEERQAALVVEGVVPAAAGQRVIAAEAAPARPL